MLAEASEDMGRGQAERLAPMVDEVLGRAGLTPADLLAIAVCTGPGNFTGARIGVAMARGLSLSCGRPSVGATRLAAMAACTPGEGRIIVTAAAKRGEIFAQPFKISGQHAQRELAPIALGLPEALVDMLRVHGAQRVVGPGAGPLGAALNAAAGDEDDFAPPLGIARVSLAALEAAAPGLPPRPAPVYLRPADAAPSSHAPPPLIAP